MKNEHKGWLSGAYWQNPLKTTHPLPIMINRAYIRRVGAS
ncbi:hypothetical protein CES86_0784 [Brucella lupini]|uniref:Uncharacterized protein n=1 Tax=Brucella lupini TaxID=255457 RepID=A0A256GXV2_9HYPH|nr:hypothetical protein CES86_0784 [Brucella lupini]